MNNLTRIVSEVVCRNTVPDFDSKGNPVLIWKARAGYKAISDTISEIFTEPQNGDAGKLENWLDLGCGLYRYRLDENTAYEICMLNQRPDVDILENDADMYIIGIAHPTNGTPYFGRFKLMECCSLKRCLEYAKKDMEDSE